MKYKAVIFDMDGVITDSEKPYISIFPKLCHEYGYNVSELDITNTLGTSYEYTKDYFEKKFSNKFPYDTIFNNFENMLIKMAYCKQLKLKPYVQDILEFLKLYKINIALASSNTKNAVYSYLDAFDIKQYFDVIYTGDDVLNGKPDPEIFIKTIDKLNLKSNECIIIEDSINGLKAARLAGATTVMVPDLVSYNPGLCNIVDYCFNTVNEIKQIIK